MNDRTLATSGVRTAVSSRTGVQAASFTVILSLSFCHLLNDLMQSLVPALYPILKTSYGLSFGQIGVITLTMQCTASMLQPAVGLYTDRRPQPYSPSWWGSWSAPSPAAPSPIGWDAFP